MIQLAAQTITGAGEPFDLRDSLRGIVGLWALCAAGMALRMVLGLLWIQRAVREDAPRHRDQRLRWEASLARLALRFDVTRTVRLRIVDTLASPVTAGWWRTI